MQCCETIEAIYLVQEAPNQLAQWSRSYALCSGILFSGRCAAFMEKVHSLRALTAPITARNLARQPGRDMNEMPLLECGRKPGLFMTVSVNAPITSHHITTQHPSASETDPTKNRIVPSSDWLIIIHPRHEGKKKKKAIPRAYVSLGEVS